MPRPAPARFRRHAAFGLALALLLPLAGCVSGGIGGVGAAGEAEAIARVNAFRAENGLPPVRRSAALSRAAADHSRRMAAAGTVSHTLGGPLTARIRSAGVTHWWGAAENLAMGQPTYGAAVTSWMRSPGHRRNLLDPVVTEAGMAPSSGSGRPYWTMILAAPR